MVGTEELDGLAAPRLSRARRSIGYGGGTEGVATPSPETLTAAGTFRMVVIYLLACSSGNSGIAASINVVGINKDMARRDPGT
jgi:hypothetical protein